MQEGKCPVYLRIVVNGTRSELSLKSMAAPDEWNLSKGMAKGKTETLKNIIRYQNYIRQTATHSNI